MAEAQPSTSKKLSIVEKLDKALEFKEQGNSFYKEQNFKKAAKSYHKAILYLKGIDTDLHGTPAFLQGASVDPNHDKHIDKEVEEKCIQTNISVYNNLCACLLQQADSSSERIKQLAEIVIELDKNNEKAWYRRGQACVKLKDFETAKESFSKVTEISGGKNKDVAKWIRQCDVQLEKNKNKEKKMYQEMFKPQKSDEDEEILARMNIKEAKEDDCCAEPPLQGMRRAGG